MNDLSRKYFTVFQASTNTLVAYVTAFISNALKPSGVIERIICIKKVLRSQMGEKKYYLATFTG